MPLIELPSDTRRLIASTQIITSVSGAVKELVENAIDAGANGIQIKLVNYGLEEIEVQDDGEGVRKSEVSNMCLPHFTSKLTEFADLGKLESYGFRGEALYSLCSVSNVTITTRTSEDKLASAFTMNKEGKIVDVKPSHFGIGTTVSVKNIFHNLPVRKKLLSSSNRPKLELKKTEYILKNLALINIGIHFSFCHNKCILWQKSRAQSLQDSVMSVLGYSISSQLEEITEQLADNVVSLMIPKRHCKDLSDLCSSTVDALRIFFNNRPVRYSKLEKVIVKQIKLYFGDKYPRNKYPSCIVKITVPSSELDVNLEPNKTKVLCLKEDEIVSAVEKMLELHYQLPNPIEKIANESLKLHKLNEETILEETESPPRKKSRPEISNEKSETFLLSSSYTSKENQISTANTDLWDTNGSGIEPWSKGCVKSSSGDIIEGGATLLLPNKSAFPDKATEIEKKSGMFKMNAKKTDSGRKNSLHNSSFHSVSSQMGCKEMESFTKFSREVRPKILADNPGLAFTKVASILAKQWKELPLEEKTHYNESKESNIRPLDDKILNCTIPYMFKASESLKGKSSRHLIRKKELIDINIEDMKKWNNRTIEALDTRLHLIGQLKPEGIWLYTHKHNIGVVRHWALQEKYIYKQLLSEGSIPVVPLESPITLKKEDLECNLWDILMQLETTTTTTGMLLIASSLITKNGFRVEKLNEDICIITHAASTIRFYGVNDLREILKLAQKSSNIAQCRPVKVIAYLESEAVRIARQAPAIIEKEQLLKLFNLCDIRENVCLHQKPVFEIFHTFS